MVTAALIFNLDNPDDVERHRRALKADMLQLQIDTFYQECFRSKIKHEELPDNTRATMEKMLADLREHFKECYSEN